VPGAYTCPPQCSAAVKNESSQSAALPYLCSWSGQGRLYFIAFRTKILMVGIKTEHIFSTNDRQCVFLKVTFDRQRLEASSSY
jgi:hypothetical protein